MRDAIVGRGRRLDPLSDSIEHLRPGAISVFADRQEYLQDPAAGPIPVEELLSPEWIAERQTELRAQADQYCHSNDESDAA